MTDKKETKEEKSPEESKESSAKITLAGKEFDISTKEGLIQAQAWSEAMSTMVGKQGQELGDLRKFKSSMSPTEDQEKLLNEVSKLREDGENLKADELIIAYSQRSSKQTEERFKQERAKDNFFRSYLDEHPEIRNVYGEDDFRTITESRFDFSSDVSFKDLDGYWNQKVQKPKTTETEDPVVQTVPSGRPVEKKAPEKGPSVKDVLSEFDLA